MDPLTDCPICFETYEPERGVIGSFWERQEKPHLLGPDRNDLWKQKGCFWWKGEQNLSIKTWGFLNLVLGLEEPEVPEWRSTAWTCRTALGSEIGLLSAIAMLPLSTLPLGCCWLKKSGDHQLIWRISKYPVLYRILYNSMDLNSYAIFTFWPIFLLGFWWIRVMKQKKWFHDTVGCSNLCFWGVWSRANDSTWRSNLETWDSSKKGLDQYSIEDHFESLGQKVICIFRGPKSVWSPWSTWCSQV